MQATAKAQGIRATAEGAPTAQGAGLSEAAGLQLKDSILKELRGELQEVEQTVKEGVSELRHSLESGPESGRPAVT